MSTGGPNHPSEELLRALVLGQLSEAEAPTVEAHLTACETCLERLEKLPTDSPLEQRLRDNANLPDAAEQPVREWLDRLKGEAPAAIPSAGAEHEILQQLGPPQAPDELGTLGRYRILAKLGSGGMGCVFKALHPVMDRVVALKVMSRDLLRHPGALARFHREIRAVARLQHPNIVQAYDADSVGDLHFLVMECVSGIDLRELVRRDGPLAIHRAADYVWQAALALQHAHEKGMVHRDVKPSNLMLGTDGQVKLLDLGLARLHEQAAPEQQTSVGVVLGTPDFMAPEQAGDPHTVDIRGDVYSLGCTLYFLLTGRVPFPDVTVVQKIMAHQQRQPESLATLRPELPAELIRLVEKMMAKNPEERYAVPSEVAVELLPFVRVASSDASAADGTGRISAAQDATISDEHKTEAPARDDRELGLPVPGTCVDAPLVTSRAGPPLETRQRPRLPSMRARVTMCVACAMVAMLGATAFKYGGAVYRIATNQGVIEIVTDDPDVEVRVKRNGERIAILDAKTHREVTLDAGRYQLELAKGKDGLRLVADEFTLERNGREIARVRRIPTEDAAAKATVAPFVILGRGTKSEQPFGNIADAVAAAQSGDTIEIRGNGPYVCDSITFENKSLVVRAGKGYWPILRQQPDTAAASKPFLIVRSPLVLEGLEFQRFRDDDKEGIQGIHSSGSGCFISNCSFKVRTKSTSNVLHLENQNWQIRNSFFLRGPTVGVGVCQCRNLESGVFENNLLVGQETGIFFVPRKKQPRVPSLRFTHNTIVGGPTFFVALFDKPEQPHGQAGDPMVQFDAQENIVDPRGFTPHWFLINQVFPSPMSAAEAETFLRQRVVWKERQNLWGPPALGLGLIANHQRQQPTQERNSLADWNAFWGQNDTGSIEGAVRYQGGKLPEENSNLDEYLPEHFRLADGSPGKGAGSDGKDLGADVDLVGPGPAYERWKQTPNYQQWLKESAQIGVPSLGSDPAKELEKLADAVQRIESTDPADPRVVALRRDLLKFMQKSSDPSARIQATALMSWLAWPVDTLERDQIDPYELKVAGSGDPAKAPAELVALLGDSRLKHWNSFPRAIFSHGGTTLLTLTWDGMLKEWDVTTGEELRSVSGISYAYRAGRFAPDASLVASGRYDGVVELWDARTGESRRRIAAFGERISAVAFSQDGTLLAVAAASGAIKLCETTTGRVRQTLKGHTAEVGCLCFNRDGNRLASACDDRTVKLWDVASGQEVATLRGHTEPAVVVTISPDGSTVASSGVDATIRIWDAATGEVRKILKASSRVESLEFNPDGTALASGHSGGDVRLWDLDTGNVRRSFSGPTNWIFTLAFSPDGSTLAAGDQNCGFQLWDVASGEAKVKCRAHTAQVRTAVVSPDGSTLVSGSSDGTFRIWNLWDRQERHVISAPYMANATAFAPDGRLATASWTGMVKLWKADTGDELRALGSPRKYSPALALSPDGTTLVAATDQGTIHLWDLATGKERQTRPSHSAIVLSLAFGPDGKTFASASEDGTVKLWDAASGEEIRTLERRTGRIRAVAFHPGGRIIATGGYDRSIRLWDAQSGDELHALSGHSEGVISLAFSPDGARLASSGYDGTVRVWESQSGLQQKAIRLCPTYGWINQVCFTPDGRHLVSANANGTVYVLRLAPRPDTATFDAESKSVGPGQVGVLKGTALILSLDYSRTGPWILTGNGLQGGSGPDQSNAPAEGYLVKLWNLETGQQVQAFPGHTAPVFRVALTDDGHQALSYGDGSIRRWDIKSGRELGRLSVGPGVCAAFSLGGRRAVTAAGDDKVVRLWDLETNKQLQEFTGHTEEVNCAALSQDGSQVLSAGGGVYSKSKSGSDYSLRLWNAKTGKLIHRLEGHSDLVFAVRFSPDGRRALSGSWDGSVRLWDLASGKETRKVIESSTRIYDVAWVADKPQCLVSFFDGTVRLLDVETTEELHVFYGHVDKARPIACSADGKYAISGGYDRTVRWWRLPEPDLTQPASDSGPFVILHRDGTAEQKLSTLARAVANAHSGDTIEIHGNGPFMCRPITLSKPLTVRAGAGFVPILQLEKDAIEFDRPFIETTARLTLEGLVLHRQGMGNPDAYKPTHVTSHRADLRIANCRFTIEGSSQDIFAVKAEGSPHFEVCHCEFLGPWNFCLGWDMVSAGRMSVDNSIFRGRSHAVMIYNNSRDLEDVNISMTRNTFLRGFTFITSGDATATIPPSPAVSVKSIRNLWETQTGTVKAQTYGFRNQAEVDGYNDSESLRGWLTWHEENNLYGSDEKFLVSVANVGAGSPRSVFLAKDLAERNRFWKQVETGSAQGRIQFRGGPRVRTDSAGILTADDFRLTADSSGKAAAPDGTDLGADIDMVGPGPAYERWKQTPDYQQWLRVIEPVK